MFDDKKYIETTPKIIIFVILLNFIKLNDTIIIKNNPWIHE